MEKNRTAGRAAIACRSPHDRKGGFRIACVAGKIGQARTVSEIVFDPALRGLDRYADPIILANKQDGHGACAPGRPCGSIHGALGGRMVCGGIAKAAKNNGIVRKDWLIKPDLPGKTQRIGRPHGLGQMRGDGARLGRDKQIPAAKNLVAPAGNRVLCRRTK